MLAALCSLDCSAFEPPAITRVTTRKCSQREGLLPRMVRERRGTCGEGERPRAVADDDAPPAPLLDSVAPPASVVGTSQPALQNLNRLLHTPPLSIAVRGLFWSTALVAVAPLMGCALFVLTAIECARHAALLPFGTAGGTRLRPGEEEEDAGGGAEYAVVITGCDSGFGRDVAVELGRRGFAVFAGCLTEGAVESLGGCERVMAVKMDVTGQEEVDRAAERVLEWVKGGRTGRPRYLHAVINNAGVGTAGLVDWIEICDYQRDMEGAWDLRLSIERTPIC